MTVKKHATKQKLIHLMYNAKTAYARYSANNALKTASAEVTLKRKLENDIDEQCKNDAR